MKPLSVVISFLKKTNKMLNIRVRERITLGRILRVGLSGDYYKDEPLGKYWC